jgi:hypothetical protein
MPDMNNRQSHVVGYGPFCWRSEGLAGAFHLAADNARVNGPGRARRAGRINST